MFVVYFWNLSQLYKVWRWLNPTSLFYCREALASRHQSWEPLAGRCRTGGTLAFFNLIYAHICCYLFATQTNWYLNQRTRLDNLWKNLNSVSVLFFNDIFGVFVSPLTIMKSWEVTQFNLIVWLPRSSCQQARDLGTSRLQVPDRGNSGLFWFNSFSI